MTVERKGAEMDFSQFALQPILIGNEVLANWSLVAHDWNNVLVPASRNELCGNKTTTPVDVLSFLNHKLRKLFNGLICRIHGDSDDGLMRVALRVALVYRISSLDLAEAIMSDWGVRLLEDFP